VGDEVGKIVAEHGIAAGEDEERGAHVGDLVDEGFAFGVGELVGMAAGLGASARQCRQARAQARVISQATTKGWRSRSTRMGARAEPMPREPGVDGG
jgi:hypothetical protein